MSRSATLALLAASLVTGRHVLPKRQADVSLDELIKARGKDYFGVATDQGLLTTGSNADIIIGNFGQVTPENSMKWDAVERT